MLRQSVDARHQGKTMTIRAPLSSFSNGIYPAETELKISMPNARDEIFAHVRPLRAYAILLIGDRARADDLAEETLRKAWGDFASFQRGGNLRAWLFTILRGAFSSRLRNAERGAVAEQGTLPDGPTLRLEVGTQDLVEFRRAFAALPALERETLLLVGAEGFSHEAVAMICGCAVRTIDSRANRGKQRLAQLLASSVTSPAEADNGRTNTRPDSTVLARCLLV